MSRHPAAHERSVLVGLAAFAWLKTQQQQLPPPRLDMRYLIEGSVAALQSSVPQWSVAARQAMVGCLTSAIGTVSTQAEQEQPLGACACSEGGMSLASPRTQGTAAREDCRSLVISASSFDALQRLQDTTRPRLELRFWLDGGMACLQQEPALIAPWLAASRQALGLHLAQLACQPIPITDSR